MSSPQPKNSIEPLSTSYFKKKLSPLLISQNKSYIQQPKQTIKHPQLTHTKKHQHSTSQIIYTEPHKGTKKDKVTLKERINQKLRKELRCTQMKNIEWKDINELNKNKENIPRQSCIRKMLFQEDGEQSEQKGHGSKREVTNSKKIQNRQQQRYQFQERQKRLLQLRKEKCMAREEQVKKSQMRQCTFKPKLTKYLQFI